MVLANVKAEFFLLWSTVITGYMYDTRKDEMVEFARGNPQWPQAFYPVTQNVTLTPGDFFVARCTYNTTNNPNPTFIGKLGTVWPDWAF